MLEFIGLSHLNQISHPQHAIWDDGYTSILVTEL